MFGRSKSVGDKRIAELVEQVEQVAVQLGELRTERSTLELETRIDSLSKEKERLRGQIADLASEKARSELDVTAP